MTELGSPKPGDRQVAITETREGGELRVAKYVRAATQPCSIVLQACNARVIGSLEGRAWLARIVDRQYRGSRVSNGGSSATHSVSVYGDWTEHAYSRFTVELGAWFDLVHTGRRVGRGKAGLCCVRGRKKFVPLLLLDLRLFQLSLFMMPAL